MGVVWGAKMRPIKNSEGGDALPLMAAIYIINTTTNRKLELLMGRILGGRALAVKCVGGALSHRLGQ